MDSNFNFIEYLTDEEKQQLVDISKKDSMTIEDLKIIDSITSRIAKERYTYQLVLDNGTTVAVPKSLEGVVNNGFSEINTRTTR